MASDDSTVGDHRSCPDDDCDGEVHLEVPEAHEWFCMNCNRGWVLLETGKFVGGVEA